MTTSAPDPTAALQASIQLAIRRSVQEFPNARTFPAFGMMPYVDGGLGGYGGGAGTGGSVYWLANRADGFSAWGFNPNLRDRQLRLFYPTEPIVKSSIGSIIARNMSFEFVLDGPPRGVDATMDLLHTANAGAGWANFVGKFSADLYTQDKGAFIEPIRTADSPDAPVVGLQNLDAARCWHTGDPTIPVLYQDREGAIHELKWYQVITVAEMPVPHEFLYGLQYSALTRILEAAVIFRDMQTYTAEKVSGRRTRALHLVGGVTDDRIAAAIAGLQNQAQEAGNVRYMGTPIVTGLDPAIAPTLATLDFASLPDGFDPEKAFNEYVNIVAMGLFVDRQDLAPLAHGSLGSGAQSEILAQKTKGKGPALFMRLLAGALNNSGVIPSNVTFRWDEQDVQADKAVADVSDVRATTRRTMQTNGELDAHGARQKALDDGDLSPDLFNEMEAADVEIPTTNGFGTTGDYASGGTTRLDVASSTAPDEMPGSSSPDDTTTPSEATKALARRLMVGYKADPVRTNTLSAFLENRLHRAFTTAADDLMALGYMDTDERINLSGLIGKALQNVRTLFGDGAADVVARNLDGEDARLLVATATKEAATRGSASSAVAGRGSVGGPSGEHRRALEETASGAIGTALGQTFRALDKRIRGR